MTIVYAHRGARAELPENTLPAFRRALELGADALEIDCHMTRDGVVVVAHDETGERMAGVAREIKASTFADVRAWDAGRGFRGRDGDDPHEGRGFQVPALEEVLTELPTLRLNIDAKQEEPDMIPALLRVIREHRATSRVQLASFSDRNLARIRRAGYEGGTSLGPREIAKVLALPEVLLRAFRPAGTRAQLPRQKGPLPLDTPRFIAKCHALGIKVDYWTINEPEDAIELSDRGADGIVTDDPRVIVPALRNAGERRHA